MLIADKEKDEKRVLVANILGRAMCSKQSKNPIDKEILHINKKTKIFLKDNPDLVVLNADKGNRTVFMSRLDYNRKMDEHFSDASTYKLLSYDTTCILENRLISLAKNLLERKYITDKVYRTITKHNSSVSKAYGLPKIHKVDIPVRIIEASYESPAHEISAFVAEILKKLTANSKYNVKNSFELVKRFSGLKIDPGELMTSFDVKSLFTNVSVDYALEIIDERWNEVEIYTPIPKEEFFIILNFILFDCNQFKYNGRIYKQNHGTPMGLSLSPILADIVMEKSVGFGYHTISIHPDFVCKIC